MGIFSNLFGEKSTDSEKLSRNWFHTLEDLIEIVEKSRQVPVAIFKHSTRCNISSMAMDRLERHWDFNKGELEIYFLDLILHRNVSNRIAEDFAIDHASPQLILLKDGNAIYDTSHNDISVDGLRAALNRIS